jgi:nucleoid DNA-binding protein
VNHTQRVAYVAQQRRSLTKAVVRESVELYLKVLAEEISAGNWVDILEIGKLQVCREEGKGYVTSITSDGQHIRRKVRMRLRTKMRLYEKFKKQCKVQNNVK